MDNYGVIQEQGDLGLGFDPISESERETIERNEKNNSDEHTNED